MFLNNLIFGLFYLAAALAIAICILTANNMSRETCICLRSCLILIIIGLMALVCAVWYRTVPELLALAAAPVLLGLTGWLIFDRYRAHEDLDLLAMKIKAYGSLLRDSILRFFRKDKKAGAA